MGVDVIITGEETAQPKLLIDALRQFPRGKRGSHRPH
jgi:hypothetical protein